MQRVTISTALEQKILEIQEGNPFLEKPIDVIKIALNNFYNDYKQGQSVLLKGSGKVVAKSFWNKQKVKPKTIILTQAEIDKLSHVS